MYLPLDDNNRPAIFIAQNPVTTSVSISNSGGTGAAAIPGTALTRRVNIIMRNTGSKTVYLGGTGVTSSTGLPLKVDEALPFVVGDDVGIYGICAGSDTSTVIVFEA